MTLGEKIKMLEKSDPEMIIGLKDKYGVNWIGKVKFVFGAVRKEAWESSDIQVVRNGKIL